MKCFLEGAVLQPLKVTFLIENYTVTEHVISVIKLRRHEFREATESTSARRMGNLYLQTFAVSKTHGEESHGDTPVLDG